MGQNIKHPKPLDSELSARCRRCGNSRPDRSSLAWLSHGATPIAGWLKQHGKSHWNGWFRVPPWIGNPYVKSTTTASWQQEGFNTGCQMAFDFWQWHPTYIDQLVVDHSYFLMSNTLRFALCCVVFRDSRWASGPSTTVIIQLFCLKLAYRLDICNLKKRCFEVTFLLNDDDNHDNPLSLLWLVQPCPTHWKDDQGGAHCDRWRAVCFPGQPGQWKNN